MRQHILLTGVPGCGKTTVILRLHQLLREAGIPAAGFYTEEIREDGRRVGFGIRTLAGASGVLAHVNIRSPYRVSRYGVDTAAFEALAIPALSPDQAVRVFLIDEIGKMETFSARFVKAVERLLDGDKPVVATVALKGGGAIGRIRCRSDAELIAVTPANRDGLPGLLLERVARGAAGNE